MSKDYKCLLRLTTQFLEKMLGLPEGVVKSLYYDFKTDSILLRLESEKDIIESDYGNLRLFQSFEGTQPREALLRSKRNPTTILVNKQNGSTILGIPGDVVFKEVCE